VSTQPVRPRSPSPRKKAPDYLREARRDVWVLLPLASQSVALMMLLIWANNHLDKSTLYFVLTVALATLPWIASLWVSASDPLLPDALGARIRPFVEALILHLLLWLIVLPPLDGLSSYLVMREVKTGVDIAFPWMESILAVELLFFGPWLALCVWSGAEFRWPVEYHCLILTLIYLTAAALFLLFAAAKGRPARRDGSERRWLRLLALCLAGSFWIALLGGI